MTEKNLIQSANAGNVAAMKQLAEFYLKQAQQWRGEPAVGESVSISELMKHIDDDKKGDKDKKEIFRAKAFKWWLKAAEAGDAESMLEVAGALYDAIGVEQNQPRALEWYEKAANLGNVRAMNITAHFYGFGLGLEKSDYEKSFYWYSKSAAQGSFKGIGELVKLYHEGKGTPPDENKADEFFALLPKDKAVEIACEIADRTNNADKWLNIAINLESPAAILWQAENYCGNRQFDKAIESCLRIVEINKKSSENYSSFAAEAYIKIGDIFYTGDNGAQSFDKALKYYKKAANLGGVKGKMQLAMLYYQKKNFDKAYEIFYDVATGNGEFLRGVCINSCAWYFVGLMNELKQIKTGTAYLEIAIKAYKLAMKHSSAPEAAYRLADIFYLNGDFEQALKWYEEAAKYPSLRTFFEAANKVACMYELGEGVPVNLEKAAQWREKLKTKD